MLKLNKKRLQLQVQLLLASTTVPTGYCFSTLTALITAASVTTTTHTTPSTLLLLAATTANTAYQLRIFLLLLLVLLLLLSSITLLPQGKRIVSSVPDCLMHISDLCMLELEYLTLVGYKDGEKSVLFLLECNAHLGNARRRNSKQVTRAMSVRVLDC